MIVVSDTGPINYLIVLGHIEILEQLFDSVLIPSAVLAELSDKSAPRQVQIWLMNIPNWVEIRDPSHFDSSSRSRGLGERAAIALAKELQAPVLSDDKGARQIARSEGLVVSGTLGILIEADVRGLLAIELALDNLAKAGFFLSDQLVERVLRTATKLRNERSSNKRI